MTIEQINNHAEKAKERLPRFLDGAANFNALIDIIGSRTQGLETELFNLLDQRNLSDAVGVQLDGLGTILNLEREVGQSDGSYRQALIGETGQLSLSGQIDALINVFNTLTQAVDSEVVEFFPAGVLLTAFFDGDLVNPDVDKSIVDAMNKTKAAGVILDLRYAEETTFFELSQVSETDVNGNGPTSADHGLGDELLLEGGGLSRLIKNIYWYENLLLYSEQFDNAVWAKANATLTINVADAPDGTQTMDNIEDTSVIAFANVAQSLPSFNVNSIYNVSLHIEKDAIPKETRFCLLRLQFGGSTSEINDFNFDTSTGEFFMVSSVTILAYGVIDLGDHWRIYVASVSNDVANTSGFCQFFPAAGNNSTWTLSNTALGSVNIWGAQVTSTRELRAYTKTEATIVGESR